MFAVERQKRILELLNENGAVTVSRLAEELEVTEETVRRDLEKLEKASALIRTHGGAIPFEESNQELSLKERKKLNTEAKTLLAKEAVKHIHSGDTVFLDASTTTYYIAKEIKVQKNITVVTNSLRVVNELAGIKDIKVICIGGIVGANQSVVGSMAEENIRESYFTNKLFFSSRGINKSGILDSNEQECFIKRCMIKNASKVYYVCDKSKFGKIGYIKLADFGEIHRIITEKSTLDDEVREMLNEHSVKILEV